MKIKSALLAKRPQTYLRNTYENIYQDENIWKFSNFDGVHAIIWNLLKDKLLNSSVLDVGCGTGRLSFYLDTLGKRVLGIDFSQKAIEKALFLHKFIPVNSLEFRVANLENISEKFDIIIFADVLEHVNNPVATLKNSYKNLNNKGILIFSCPGFLNLRGLIYKTLLNSLNLPMSLADVRQVDFIEVNNWAEQTHFKLEKIVGGLYDLGWGEIGINDLLDRLPKVLEDKPIKEFKLDRFNNWLKSEKTLYEDFMQTIRKKHLKKVTNLPKLKVRLPETIKEYLIEGFKRNPYYCEDYPYNLWGGETIYLLKKQ